MRGLLWVLALFALAVGAALSVAYNDGYLLLVVPPYRVELSLNLAMLLMLGAFLLFYGVLRGVALTRTLPRRVRDYRQRRQQERQVAAFVDATRQLFEGNYGQALGNAAEAYKSALSPALSALLAARAAQRLDDPEAMQKWLERAVDADPKMQVACQMLEAEMQLEAGCFEAAISTLQRVQKLAGCHVGALRLELLAQQGMGKRDEVLRVAQLLEDKQALTPAQAQEIRISTLQPGGIGEKSCQDQKTPGPENRQAEKEEKG